MRHCHKGFDSWQELFGRLLNMPVTVVQGFDCHAKGGTVAAFKHACVQQLLLGIGNVDKAHCHKQLCAQASPEAWEMTAGAVCCNKVAGVCGHLG